MGNCMFCTNCDKEDSELDVPNPVCKSCGFDNSYVLGLIAEDDDDEDEEIEDEFRTSLVCAQRCVILYGILSAGHGEDRNKIISWLKDENLREHVSKQEIEYLESKTPTEQQVVNATWRVEALHLLLWTLKKVDSASNLNEMCDVGAVQTLCGFYLGSTKDFIESCNLREEDEIYDLNELIYDSHWKVRDAQINGKKIPDNLDSGVVQERHYAINWLMGYCGQDWDEITTDT